MELYHYFRNRNSLHQYIRFIHRIRDNLIFYIIIGSFKCYTSTDIIRMISRGKITSAENDSRLTAFVEPHWCGSSRNESFRVKVPCFFCRKSFITQCNSTLWSWTNERTNDQCVTTCFSLHRTRCKTSNLSSLCSWLLMRV